MKIINKIICICLTIIVALGVAACGAKGEPQNTIKGNLIERGVSEYSIIIPEQNQGKIKFASEELQMFLEKSTGVKLNIITDAEYDYSASSKIISLGETSLLKSAGILYDLMGMTSSEYKISTKDNSYFIYGNEDGVLYGVYDLLRELIDFEVFASDEIYCSVRTIVPFKVINVSYKPPFEVCVFPTGGTNIDPLLADRFKTTPWRTFWGSVYGETMATMFALIPKATYWSEHRDWYNTAGDDMCYTNIDMQNEVVERLKRVILSSTEKELHLMIGQQDNCTACSCSNCMPLFTKYGGAAASIIQFANEVSDKINAWLKENSLNKKVYLGIFAYQISLSAPVNVSEDKTTYTPMDDSLILRDNVITVLAPIGANYAFSFKEEVNESFATTLKSWSAICENICLWTYGANFSYFVYPYDNVTNMVENIEFFQECNVKYMFEQGMGSGTMSLDEGYFFLALRRYLLISLCWNSDADIEELTDKFFEHYYKIAAKPMREYYDKLRVRLIYNRDNVSSFVGLVYHNLPNKKYWPKGSVDEWTQLINQAKIEANKITDVAERDKLINRIDIEELTPLYMNISLYSNYFTNSEMLDMKIKFKTIADRNNMGCVSEGISTISIYKSWGIM